MSMPIEFQQRRNYSIIEAADQLRISRSMVYKLNSEQKIKFVKLGRRSLVTAAELDRIQKAMERGAL